MRHLKRTLLALLIVVLVLGAAGCTGDQTAEANKAIDAANVQLKKYSQAGTEIEQLLNQVEKLPMDRANAKKALPLTDKMNAKLEEQRKAAEAAKAEITKIKAMDVRDEFKTYADKEIAITNVLLEEYPVYKKLFADLRQIYAGVVTGRITEKDVATIGKRIDAESKQLTDLEAKAAKLEREASDYFNQQKLGEGGQ
jgi:hypothetical protein